MKFAYSNARVREADGAAIAAGTPSSELMERAGEALARTVQDAMHRLGVGDALFVCGGGNNGGDGFVAARLLMEAGESVQVLCLATRFSQDCERARSRFCGEVYGVVPRRRYAILVDCLFGTGLSRAPEGTERALIEYLNGSGAYVISCDLPSGLAEGGIAFEPCVRADKTVCMGALKQALLLSDGADYAGEIELAPIGISCEREGAEVWEEGDAAAFFPRRKSNVHKGTFGSASIFAASALGGAAFLAAAACLKSGAGYTRLCVSEELYPYAVGRLPSCVLRTIRAIDGELLASDSIALGMGAGVTEQLYAYLMELLPEYTGTLVLDADALNTLAQYGTEVLKEKACTVIVTPHPKEFSRLCGRSVKEILSDPVSAAKAFASEYGVIVALKNNRTVITDGTRCAINCTGCAALAKGGSGDVLAGFLTGTLARGVAPFEAACLASYVLGRAGEEAARELGEYAPDATDVIAALPRVLKGLEEKAP